MDRKTKISVVISTNNRPVLLFDCLRSLADQSRKPDEVLIVDNSPDHSAEKVATSFGNRFPARYYHENRKGSPFVRNLGIRRARCDLLVFMDDDCIAGKSWIENILVAHKKYVNCVITGKNLNGLPENIYACVEHFFTEQVFRLQTHRNNNSSFSSLVDTKNFSVRKSILERNKVFFDESFAKYSIMEDVDFSHRLSLVGIDIIYDSNIIVHHFGCTEFISHIRREFRKGEALYYYGKKWKFFKKKPGSIHGDVSTAHDWKCFFRKRQVNAKNIINKLNKETLQGKNIFFMIRFNLMCVVSRVVIRAGYFYESVITSRLFS